MQFWSCGPGGLNPQEILIVRRSQRELHCITPHAVPHPSHDGALLSLFLQCFLILLHLPEIGERRPPVLLHVLQVGICQEGELGSPLKRRVVGGDEVETPLAQLGGIVDLLEQRRCVKRRPSISANEDVYPTKTVLG